MTAAVGMKHNTLQQIDSLLVADVTARYVNLILAATCLLV